MNTLSHCQIVPSACWLVEGACVCVSRLLAQKPTYQSWQFYFAMCLDKCCDHSVHAVMTKVGIANGPMGWGFHPEVSRRKQKFCSAGVSLVDC